jgi:hypothetical protein
VPVLARAAVWGARLAWLAVAVAGGAAVGAALDDHSRTVQLAGTAAAWAGWAVGALALAVSSVATLTLARTTVPGSLVVAFAAIVDGAGALNGLAMLAPAIAASSLVVTAEFGRVYLQASAYGDELRFGLRPPIGYLVASAVTWLPTVTAVVLVVPALAGQAWVLGVACFVVAAAGLALLPERWHQLSRRWLVIVPAGLVVHDPVVLTETLMLRRATIAAVALGDPDAPTRPGADLTGPAPGVAVEIRLAEPATTVLAPTVARRDGTAIRADTLLVSPSRPGAALRAAGAAGYPTR